MEKGETFAIAAPALNEFLFGIGTLPRAVHNLREWERLKQDFQVYAMDRLDAEESAKLRLALRRRGWQLGIIDSFIAVIALRYDLTLLTTDQDFAAIPNLKQQNWRILKIGESCRNLVPTFSRSHAPAWERGFGGHDIPTRARGNERN